MTSSEVISSNDVDAKEVDGSARELSTLDGLFLGSFSM